MNCILYLSTRGAPLKSVNQPFAIKLLSVTSSSCYLWIILDFILVVQATVVLCEAPGFDTPAVRGKQQEMEGWRMH